MQRVIKRPWNGSSISLGLATLILLANSPIWADEKAEYGDKSHGGRSHQEGKGHGFSSGMRGHGTGHYLRHLLRHKDEIGLTDDQINKLKAIHLELDKTRIRTEAEILVAERELASLADDEKADLASIEAKLKQSEGLETSLRMAAIKAKREALALLNPDQRKQERIEHDKMMQQHRGTDGAQDGMGREGTGSGETGEKKDRSRSESR
jgi:protein CpxP